MSFRVVMPEEGTWCNVCQKRIAEGSHTDEEVEQKARDAGWIAADSKNRLLQICPECAPLQPLFLLGYEKGREEALKERGEPPPTVEGRKVKVGDVWHHRDEAKGDPVYQPMKVISINGMFIKMDDAGHEPWTTDELMHYGWSPENRNG